MNEITCCLHKNFIVTTVMFCNQITIQQKKTYLTKWFIKQTIFKKVTLFAYEMTDIFYSVA